MRKESKCLRHLEVGISTSADPAFPTNVSLHDVSLLFGYASADTVNSALLRCNVAHILRRIGLDMKGVWMKSVTKEAASTASEKNQEDNEAKDSNVKKSAIPGAEWRAVLMTAVSICSEASQDVEGDKKAKQRMAPTAGTVREALKRELAQSNLVLGVSLLDVWNNYFDNPTMESMHFPETISMIKDAMAQALALYQDIGMLDQVAAVHYQAGCFRSTCVAAVSKALSRDALALAGFGVAAGSVAEEKLKEEKQMHYTVASTHFTKAYEYYLDLRPQHLSNFFRRPIPVLSLYWAALEDKSEGVKPFTKPPGWTKQASAATALALQRLLQFAAPLVQLQATLASNPQLQAAWGSAWAEANQSLNSDWNSVIAQLRSYLKIMLKELLSKTVEGEEVEGVRQGMKEVYGAALKLEDGTSDADAVIKLMKMWEMCKAKGIIVA